MRSGGSNMNLYVLIDGVPAEAPERDQRVARGYQEWVDKGTVLDGTRVTILAERSDYRVGEEIRVLHVMEIVEPGLPIYVMGPKPVFDEYVDGELHGSCSSAVDGGPFLPVTYNGRVQISPGIDFNFYITSLRFADPGTHRICWQPGGWSSNILEIKIS